MLQVEKNIYTQYELLLGVLCGEIDEKHPEFQRWINQDIENRNLYQMLKGKKQVQINDLQFNKTQVFDNISYILGLNIQNKKPLYRSIWFNYVASLILVAILGITGYYSYRTIQDRTTDDSILSEDVVFHTIYVPIGGMYELLLSDSTKVFLNSDTKLVFPNYFSGETRQVELTGEAFFEVKKDAMPFVVKTSEMQITVTGTSFNVNAYADNTLINTTLVKGSVYVNVPEKPETYILRSGDNFSLSKQTDEISIQKVDTERITSWMRGELIFRNQPLEEIFATLKKWYDFEIEYNNPAIKTMRFTGSVEKQRPLYYFLNQIQIVTEIKYSNEGVKIILY
jgi:ferric-dicitrate binding protein FerR (iron transport regulator)